jgi:DNA-binding CsgD family transcriptional regulator
MTDKQIASRLFISPRTVQNHLTRMREKTGTRRRSELTRWAVIHAFT